MKLTNKELQEVKGGFFNAVLNVCVKIHGLGVAFGTKLKKIITNTLCPM